ncbi:hypothetical protein M406DRAFT_278149 [Cryphonectria parasitica EP155]|uniref:Alkaline phytoceramidase n=1 Tax=Cryphonectria parasitica (strain ATCC 38755 / EP155) TaxID=660469 RepID=A0A9P4Y147_CRYP1|nr:uncharacterized protein M406DRAFT_278149 [Cryphonectria parasitica EP155]KAF3764594.1 hypothetical protein M406DRAFT_278149 [Cryphonectria parasitica EP155]
MGHQNHHFAGDTYANAGFWSPPTSAANFCEEDYAVTWYIAEFINAISSFAYVYYALGCSIVHAGSRHSPRRFDNLSVALCLVGLTSAAYHGTLRQGAQFSDDLSMLLLCGCLLQKLYSHGQGPRAASLVTAVVVVATSGMSAYYVRSGEIVIHMNTFGAMVSLIWPRTLYLIYSSSPGGTRSPGQTAELVRRFWTAVAFLLLAYVLWHIDLERCLELRRIRESLGLPWAWALELHGWWHLLTAIGAAEYIRLVRALCNSSKEDMEG